MVCDKHKLNPVKGYSPCVGCEIEYLKHIISVHEERTKEFRETIDKNYHHIKELELEIEELKDEIYQVSKYVDNF